MDIVWKKEEINSRLNKLVDSIVELAMDDDVVSDDEQALIDVVKNHIFEFEDQFVSMIDQHDDVNDVIKNTKNLFEQAIEAAAREARKDGTITSDELILIDRLAKSLRREDLSKYFVS